MSKNNKTSKLSQMFDHIERIDSIISEWKIKIKDLEFSIEQMEEEKKKVEKEYNALKSELT